MECNGDSAKRAGVSLALPSTVNRKILLLNLILASVAALVSPVARASELSQSPCHASFAQIGIRVGRDVFYAGGHAPSKHAQVMSFQSRDGSWISKIDMNWVRENPLSKISELFEVAEADRKKAYERLTKFQSPEVVAASTAMDLELRPRTVYVMNTSRKIESTQNDVLGGIRIVFARSSTERLPWELSLESRRSAPGIAAEVGRLHADTTESPAHVLELIQTAAQVVLNNPLIHDAYIHTSKIHSRMYKRMGIEGHSIQMIDDLNHIWHFTREDLQNIVRHDLRSAQPH